MTRVVRVSSFMKVNRDQKFFENRKGKGSKPVSGALAALIGRSVEASEGAVTQSGAASEDAQQA